MAALRIADAMADSRRIEMTAGRLEIGRASDFFFVDMEGVAASWHSHEIGKQMHTVRRLAERNGAQDFTVGVLHFRRGVCRKRSCGRQRRY